MGLIDYLSRNPIGLAITPSAYDEKFVVASTNSFVNILEMIDNIIPNNLANQNWDLDFLAQICFAVEPDNDKILIRHVLCY